MVFHSQCNIGLKAAEYGTALSDKTIKWWVRYSSVWHIFKQFAQKLACLPWISSLFFQKLYHHKKLQAFSLMSTRSYWISTQTVSISNYHKNYDSYVVLHSTGVHFMVATEKAESISLLCIPEAVSGTESSRNCMYQDYVVTVQNCVWMTCVSIVQESVVTRIHPLVHHPAMTKIKFQGLVWWMKNAVWKARFTLEKQFANLEIFWNKNAFQ